MRVEMRLEKRNSDKLREDILPEVVIQKQRGAEPEPREKGAEFRVMEESFQFPVKGAEFPAKGESFQFQERGESLVPRRREGLRWKLTAKLVKLSVDPF